MMTADLQYEKEEKRRMTEKIRLRRSDVKRFLARKGKKRKKIDDILSEKCAGEKGKCCIFGIGVI